MKRVLSLLMAVLMVVSVMSFAVMAEETTEGEEVVTPTPAELVQPVGVYFDGEEALEPVVLGTTEQKVWEGNVPNNTQNENGASGVTFVYKVDGVDSPIKPGSWDVAFGGRTWSNNNWFYNNSWMSNKGWGWANQVVKFEKSGLYYTFLPSRIAGAGSPSLIKDVTAFTLFKTGVPGNAPLENANENATLQMLAVIENNLQPVVNFYGLEGEFLGTTTYKYTDGVVSTTADPVWTDTFVAHGLLKTPAEIAATIEGIVLPTKESEDPMYRYELIFRDEDGNKVDGVYKSMDLYADFEAVDNTIANYGFVDATGGLITSAVGKKGETATFNSDVPEKAADADYTYTFKCWSVDGEEIDLDTYKLEADATTFVPVYKKDLILKVSGAVDVEGVAEGEKITVSFILNRTNLTTDVLADEKEPITSGKIVATYNAALYEVEGGVDGSVELAFDGVAEDGTVNAVLEMTVITSFTSVSEVSFKAIASSETVIDVETVNNKVTVTTTGERQVLTDLGTYPYNEKATLITEPFVPADKNGILTLIVEVNGLNGGTLNFGGVHIGANGIDSNNSGNMRSNADIEADPSKHQMGVFTEDGVYAVQIGAYVPQWSSDKYNTITMLNIADPSSTRGGKMVFTPVEGDEESVPTITYHALFVGAYSTNITYVDGETVIGTAEYAGPGTGLWGVNCYAVPTVDSLYTGEATPSKESDIAEVEYVLNGWADEEGNKIDTTFADNITVYPYYDVVDNRTTYNVIFKNYDGTVLYETVVPEGVTPVYPSTLGTPKKPSTETNSYEFKGWDPAISAAPTTPEADGGKGADIVYTAQYNEIERRYDVVFYDEAGENVLYEALYLVGGTEAKYEGETPVKAADVQYTYTFDKWVDFEGNDVDLTKVTSDMKVKPAFKGTLNKYTVTFVDEDEETEIGKSTVDYGTAATAPEAKKDDDAYYTYAFDKWVDAEGNDVDLSEIKGDMTVYATYSATYVHPYPDEVIKDWQLPAVEYVMVNEIMNGMDGGFKPDVNMNRAMVVTVLHRYLDTPEVEIPDDYVEFVDNEDQSTWYYDAVVWAKVNGVVNGKAGNKFDPMGNVTREEFVVILYRFADEVMGEDVKYGRASISGFADKDKISSWAHTAVKWAYATPDDLQETIPGVKYYEKTQYINGKGMKDGKPLFAPKANATRAEVATMLMRYMTGVRIKKA